MACPFLTEGQAQYCHAAPMHKLILDGPGVNSGGLCSSPQYRQCEYAAKDSLQESRCPHLEVVHVQYCGASAITKLVPFSDSQLSSCTSGKYRYCDSYLARSRPHASAPPRQLFYSANHFWLDVDESGCCHIGIDELLADVVEKVDGVVFASSQGTHCPGLTLSIHGLEWPMFFPNQMVIEGVNSRLRSDPSRLTNDPYGSGWLFEGQALTGITEHGLVSGKEATVWQSGERERLAREIHEMHAPDADGGAPIKGIARLLPRGDLLCLLQDFFGNSGWLVEE
jgi:glycine cleavage system H lipoate-binding protein